MKKNSLYFFLIFVSVLTPTMFADTAFYLSENGALSALLDSDSIFKWTLSYGGSIEYLLSIFIKNKIAYIFIFKVFIIFINFIPFKNLFVISDKNFSNIELLILFLPAQFYLAPSEYSLSVGGLSLLSIASQTDDRLKNIGLIILGLFFLGFDLPNPKYIGLGIALYTNLRLIKTFFERKYKTEFIITLIIFISIIIFFAWIYIKSNVITPPNYNIRNESNELLDLAFNRDYISAIIPFKINKTFFPLYLSTLILISHNIISNLKTIPIYIRYLLLINIYFSLGILEPTGLVEYICNKNRLFSFMRTRAGFDLYLYFFLLYCYLKYGVSTITKKTKLFFYIIFSLTIFKYCYLNFNNLVKVPSEAKIISQLEELNLNYANGCFITSSKGYNMNPVFGFGPDLIRLSTNYKIYTYKEFLTLNSTHCSVLIINKNEKSEIMQFSEYSYYSNISDYVIYIKK